MTTSPVLSITEELLQAALAQQPAPAVPAVPVAQEPVAWYVPPMTRPYWGEYAEADAKAEAARIGGTARAIPLYTAPPTAARQQSDTVPVPRSFYECIMHNLSNGCIDYRLEKRLRALLAGGDA